MRWIVAAMLIWISAAAYAAVTLPDALTKKIKGDPQGYLDAIAGLIAGYGTDGAIDQAGLDHVMALERAAARARAYARLALADLDGDGAVTLAELTVVQAAAAAAERGKLAVMFAKADGDGNSTVTAAEIQAYAGMAGLSAYSDAKAGQLRAVMAFDGNGDGHVTLDEVKAGLKELGLLG